MDNDKTETRKLLQDQAAEALLDFANTIGSGVYNKWVSPGILNTTDEPYRSLMQTASSEFDKTFQPLWSKMRTENGALSPDGLKEMGSALTKFSDKYEIILNDSAQSKLQGVQNSIQVYAIAQISEWHPQAPIGIPASKAEARKTDLNDALNQFSQDYNITADSPPRRQELGVAYDRYIEALATSRELFDGFHQYIYPPTHSVRIDTLSTKEVNKSTYDAITNSIQDIEKAKLNFLSKAPYENADERNLFISNCQRGTERLQETLENLKQDAESMSRKVTEFQEPTRNSYGIG